MDNTKWLDTLTIGDTTYQYYSLDKVHEKESLNHLPKSIKILLENTLRHYDGELIHDKHLEQLIHWGKNEDVQEVGFIPSRIVLQDFTGVPAVVDLAAMREALKRHGKDPSEINPRVPVDLVIDHSVMVDEAGHAGALEFNVNREFERNKERYRFLKWAQSSFENFRVIPPATGIIHQVNLEYLATVVTKNTENGQAVLYPDTLVGTDSHTTMINGIGILGWGVGGIEAEAGMLGQPLFFNTPEVVGVKLTGALSEGVTATDLALTVTERLREAKVVGKFVEFYGEGVTRISLPDRATVANMAPEYGATMGYFPVDDETLDYMRLTGRDEEHIQLIKTYLTKQGLYGQEHDDQVTFSKHIHIELSQVEPSLAGPKRPQDRIPMSSMKDTFYDCLKKPVADGGYGVATAEVDKETSQKGALTHGSLVLAAITSCTNTSNPSVMIGAGLIAKEAVKRGLTVPDYVKTSLTPGSQVVTDYLNAAEVMKPLEALGFHVAGYGCATCIGNSGPLADDVTKAIVDNDLVAASVLSGNRNFEGRIHQHIKANYLASPMLVVAYALAGRVDIDFETEALGVDKDGQEVFLKDLWPKKEDLYNVVKTTVTDTMFEERYKNVESANSKWNAIDITDSLLYPWEETSTYIREPEFFTTLEKKQKAESVLSAKALLALGNSITTDHISPAGAIKEDSPAGRYLKEMGVPVYSFNSYGSRRGNHEVMMRGTFANIRIRNRLAHGQEGGYTSKGENEPVLAVYDAAMEYKQEGIPLVVLAGKEYGTGSSRDWAAKGTTLLGVKAVIAESYERIHRSNLVGMGVLPLEFLEGDTMETLGLTGYESFSVVDLEPLKPMGLATVLVTHKDGTNQKVPVKVRLDSAVDIDYYLSGGILNKVLLDMIAVNE